MRYYATGTKKRKGQDGEVSIVNVLIPLTKTNRVEAVQQAYRIAKRDRLTSIDVRPAGNRTDTGGILTKNMKAEKAKRHR
jgi:hypothetical protein